MELLDFKCDEECIDFNMMYAIFFVTINYFSTRNLILIKICIGTFSSFLFNWWLEKSFFRFHVLIMGKRGKNVNIYAIMYRCISNLFLFS